MTAHTSIRLSIVFGTLALAGCGGGDTPGVTPPLPPVNGPPSTAVAALDDAFDRIAPTLGGCSARVTSELTTLRTRMSPFLNATRADVDAVRTALAACSDAGVEADRDVVLLALDVATDVLAAAGR
jgi:hypothetical protein